MSKLREQLQTAKAEYKSMRYRGDLSADLSGQLAPARKRSYWLRDLALAAGLALVATSAIVIVNRSGDTNGVAKENSAPTAADPTQQLAVENGHDPAVPQIVSPADNRADPLDVSDNTSLATNTSNKEADGGPDEGTIEEAWTLVPGEVAVAQEASVSLVPTYQAMSFSLPSIGGIDAYTTQDEPDTNAVQ